MAKQKTKKPAETDVPKNLVSVATVTLGGESPLTFRSRKDATDMELMSIYKAFFGIIDTEKMIQCTKGELEDTDPSITDISHVLEELERQLE